MFSLNKLVWKKYKTTDSNITFFFSILGIETSAFYVGPNMTLSSNSSSTIAPIATSNNDANSSITSTTFDGETTESVCVCLCLMNCFDFLINVIVVRLLESAIELQMDLLAKMMLL